MSDKEEKAEEHQHPKILDYEETEIVEQKPPNNKIIEYEVVEENQKINCPECNTENLKKAKFCSNCGKRFKT